MSKNTAVQMTNQVDCTGSVDMRLSGSLLGAKIGHGGPPGQGGYLILPWRCPLRGAVAALSFTIQAFSQPKPITP